MCHLYAVRSLVMLKASLTTSNYSHKNNWTVRRHMTRLRSAVTRRGWTVFCPVTTHSESPPSPLTRSLTPYTWAEKFESFERINSIRETNGNFDSCYSCKRLGSQPFTWVAWVKISVCFTYRIYPFETFEFFCSCIQGHCVLHTPRPRAS